jgi:hypothetical protein
LLYEMNTIPFETKSIVATLISLFRHQSKDEIVNILSNSTASIEETDYDNWNGGTHIYTLYLETSVELFASIETYLSKYEKEIASKLQVVLRDTGNTILNRVVIRPAFIDSSKIDLPLLNNKDIERIWGSYSLKVFISHQHMDKIHAKNLKHQLSKFKISAFVAHEDIEPTLPWQREIKIALNTMDIFVVLLTSQYRDSKWTDQEIGFAVAKKVFIIHVRDGLDPYGFIGETQSLSFPIDSSENLALGIVNILLKNTSMHEKMREALFVALENSNGHSIACKIMKKLESIDSVITKSEIQRIKKAAVDNSWVREAYTVQDFLKRNEELKIEEEEPF